MTHYVPDFDLQDEDYSIPTSSSSALTRPRKSPMGEEDIMELLWENGQVVVQQRGSSKKPKLDDAVTPSPVTHTREIQHANQSQQQQQQVFLQEDEMASWLHYPLHETNFENDFCADLLYPSSSSACITSAPPPTTAAAPRPPIPPSRRQKATVVDSSDTPAVSEGGGVNNTNMSSSKMTSHVASPEPLHLLKRKAPDDDVDCHSEDADFESADAKKSGRGSTSTKRSRAAEVHNLSERRRRDRINEKMRALQELIPRCNKSDKASMLDEAIEYLKSLQLQVQMMSMGCSMVPMMFPGVQQYMPPMGMMGMGMGMGMNRPMMPFPNVLAGPSLPSPAAAAAAAHLGPRFPMPAYQMPPIPSDPSRIPASTQTDPMLSAMVQHDPNQPRVPNFADPYQQYMSLHQMQIPMPQSQAMAPPSSSRPSTSEGPDSIDNHHTGT